MTTTEEAGKRGGLKTLKKYGKEHFRRIRKLGHASKMSKKIETLGITKQWLSDQSKISKDINSISG